MSDCTGVDYTWKQEMAAGVARAIVQLHRAYNVLRDGGTEAEAPVDIMATNGCKRTFYEPGKVALHAQRFAFLVMVRDGWRLTGDECRAFPTSYCVYVAPDMRVTGDLAYNGQHKDPCTVDLDVEMPEGWVAIPLDKDEREALLWFAHLFKYK